jgi:hypothetical protein
LAQGLQTEAARLIREATAKGVAINELLQREPQHWSTGTLELQTAVKASAGNLQQR